ncbi:MAG: thioredoxin family protein [Planctomycetota bacterium]
MVNTASTMLPLGSPAPDFTLPDTRPRNEATVSKGDFAGRPLLVLFICNHCPFVKHVASELTRLANDYADRVGIVAISANDADAYPADAPDKMADEAEQWGYPFPYLYDQTQAVAAAYTAACTPDLFLFDADHTLFYRGQLDDTRPYRISSGNYDARNGAAHGQDLRAALDALLAGQDPPANQRPSLGCNIKWKPGNAPAYA